MSPGRSPASRSPHCGRNPLRRRIDDVERAVLLGILAFFVVTAPLAGLLAGRAADSAGLRQQSAERSWRPEQAVLEQSADDGLVGVDGEWGASWVTARWNVPAGGHRSGLLAVGLNARKGQRFTIWVTGAGVPTRPPLSRADLLDRVASAVMMACAGLAALLGVAALIVRLVINRRRLTAWEREWAVAGPRWSSLR